MTVLNLVLGGTIFTEGGHYSPVNNVRGDIFRGDTVHYDNGFGDIKAINLLCQQPSAQLIVTLNAKHYIVEVHTKSIYFWRQWKKRSFSNWPCSVPEECVD